MIGYSEINDFSLFKKKNTVFRSFSSLGLTAVKVSYIKNNFGGDVCF